ncbi:NAD-dependent epimerase/dehydratase family protein [Catelliglobosispora koreensis]|uniref:NAD-dependent epimerase/dehydratase family protein n=1 Tax=Catelliglobosispora koreensis TaxID=129052 RepID=UPI000475C4E0|nr:NAD(P)-dependent oxidoreductase [Catelliglobosispora koreensis]
MTRVVVTGGSGKLGRAVVRELLEHGYDVVNVDQAPPVEKSAASFTQIELTDYGQVFEALTAIDSRYSGVDAVVRLAAIPGPGAKPNAVTFAHNVTVSYNVFAAAKAAGIKNVVWASSETLLGLPLDHPPASIPITEEHEPRPETSYALAKLMDETMAAQFCRWDPRLKMVGLRFSNVMEPADYAAFPSFQDDPLLRKWNLWGYIDARDGAQAVRKALEYQGTGLEIFIIANADTVMNRPSADLAAEIFPGVTQTQDLSRVDTMLSIDKARRLLGYIPQHSWRD